MERSVLHRAVAESLPRMNAPGSGDSGPSHARPQNAVAGLIEEKRAEEIVAERLVMETIDETLANLGLVRRGHDVHGQSEQRGLAMSQGATPRRLALAGFG
jgi:hypothetical protein